MLTPVHWKKRGLVWSLLFPFLIYITFHGPGACASLSWGARGTRMQGTPPLPLPRGAWSAEGDIHIYARTQIFLKIVMRLFTSQVGGFIVVADWSIPAWWSLHCARSPACLLRRCFVLSLILKLFHGIIRIHSCYINTNLTQRPQCLWKESKKKVKNTLIISVHKLLQQSITVLEVCTQQWNSTQ